MRKLKLLSYNNIYAAILFIFPFSVLFCPRLNLLFTHARIDEILVLLWLPIALKHYTQSYVSYARQWNYNYIIAFLALLAIFLIGLIYGDSSTRFSQSNLKFVTRPIFLLINIFVIRYWIYKSKIEFNSLITSLVASITLTGIVGYLAMTRTVLAEQLIDLYSSEIRQYKDDYGFDMSKRAMSVFTGYDQASLVYAIGVILCLYLFITSKLTVSKIASAITMLCLLIAIITSARTGLICLVLGALTFIAMNTKTKKKYLAIGTVLLGIFIYLLMPLGHLIIQNPDTLQRFDDVERLLDFSSSEPFWVRSHGINVILETQLRPIEYPQGLDIILGFGDNGTFVSDVGYITVYVKYGIIGIIGLLYVFAKIAKEGYQSGKRVSLFTNYLPVSTLVPTIILIFFLGSMKGGLYFITYKIGELFSIVLAICIVESELLALRIKLNNEYYVIK